MKQKFIYTLSVAAALLTTACTDDSGLQDIPVESGKGYTMTIGASMTPASRMAIENTGEAVNYYWTADDAFTVIDSKHSQMTEFVVNADSLQENSSNTQFTGTPETAYEDGQKLYAVYNKKNPVELDGNGNVNFDLSNQNGQLNEEFQYMWGETTYKDGKATEFNFRHLVTTMQVKIAVPEDVKTLSNVTLHSSHLVSKATLVLNKAPYDSECQFSVGDLVYPYSENGWKEFGQITLDGTFTPVDGYVTLYFYTLSAKQYYDNVTWYDASFITPTILYTDDLGNERVSTDFFREKEIEVGAVYGLEVNNCFKMVDFANEDQVNGSRTNPYEIANTEQLYTMMLRCYHKLADKNSNPYYRCSYLLTDNIVLDNQLLWYPFIMEDALFDGNGKTISGEFIINVHGNTGLFKHLNNTTIQNLTLDADITYEGFNSAWWASFGGIAAVIEGGSMIQRCFNNSRITFESDANEIFGGIVGKLGARSYIEYCGFSGSFTSTSNIGRIIGGIVGENFSWSTNNPIHIIGCYSDGTFQFGRIEGYNRLGGIIGSIHGDPNAVAKYCWSNISITSSYTDESQTLYWGGITGESLEGNNFSNCYWNNAVNNWTGVDNGYETLNCGPFEGNIPTAEQLKELNMSILSSGLMFSEENGHLVKNNQTVVPPSDIENW